MEGDELFDDDATAPWTTGPPADRVWRHPSEMRAHLAVLEPSPSVGFPFRTLVASFGAALVVTVAVTTVATVVVASRSTKHSLTGSSLPNTATTIDEKLQSLFTMVIDESGARRSVPALVLDGLGTIVTTLAGLGRIHAPSETAGSEAVEIAPVKRATQSQLAVLHGSPSAPVSPLGTCQSLKIGAAVQVMTANGSTTGQITALDQAKLDGVADPSTPVLIVQTSGNLDATESVLWQDGKIVAIGVERRPDGQLIAIPTDVAVGLARSSTSDGKATMPWLGISGVDDSGSVKVTNVVAASPAHGLLKVGDIIMAIDGQPVSSMWSLTVSLRRYAAEETVELRVISYGQTVNMNVTLSATNDDAKTLGSTTSSAPRQAIPGR